MAHPFRKCPTLVDFSSWFKEHIKGSIEETKNEWGTVIKLTNPKNNKSVFINNEDVLNGAVVDGIESNLEIETPWHIEW